MKRRDLIVLLSIAFLCSLAGVWLWNHRDDCILCKGTLHLIDRARLAERQEL